jgi:hypothetical protein
MGGAPSRTARVPGSHGDIATATATASAVADVDAAVDTSGNASVDAYDDSDTGVEPSMAIDVNDGVSAACQWSTAWATIDNALYGVEMVIGTPTGPLGTDARLILHPVLKAAWRKTPRSYSLNISQESRAVASDGTLVDVILRAIKEPDHSRVPATSVLVRLEEWGFPTEGLSLPRIPYHITDEDSVPGLPCILSLRREGDTLLMSFVAIAEGAGARRGSTTLDARTVNTVLRSLQVHALAPEDTEGTFPTTRALAGLTITPANHPDGVAPHLSDPPYMCTRILHGKSALTLLPTSLPPPVYRFEGVPALGEEPFVPFDFTTSFPANWETRTYAGDITATGLGPSLYIRRVIANATRAMLAHDGLPAAEIVLAKPSIMAMDADSDQRLETTIQSNGKLLYVWHTS